jgi:DNA-binding NarL/FixJ family response regulator
VAVTSAVDELTRGRAHHASGAWRDAYESLSRADRAAPLAAEDRELLATSAYMLGRDDEWTGGLERAHRDHLEAGETLPAVRCAFWLSLNLALRGEMGRATGWLGRARRLLDRQGRDCAEQGYLLIPVAAHQEATGDYAAAQASAAAAAEIGARFGDADLLAIALHEQGSALVKMGRLEEGLALLDEAMVAVTAGELSPIVTGLVYCSVIDGCQGVFELRRAQEWTAALTSWCARQPDLVAFTGTCLVHRSEIMEIRGAWSEALAEAQRAAERCEQAMNHLAAAQALYRQGEIHRLQGEFGAAEEAYRRASRSGWEPQPGLALLRLAQGNAEAAARAIRRVVDETEERLERARMLPAYVEIMLAAGDLRAAEGAWGELDSISSSHESRMLGAMSASAGAAVALASGDPRRALVSVRNAREAWQELDAPYEAARVRVLGGLACRALGDADAASMELEAAGSVFAALGAAPDLARVDSIGSKGEPADAHGLTPRELQVLRLVAAGHTNKAIAAELVLSERTVDRHVSNILAKLRLSSRAAATGYAYEHGLV